MTPSTSEEVVKSPPVRSSAHATTGEWGQRHTTEALIDDTRCRALVYETLLLVFTEFGQGLRKALNCIGGNIYERRWEVEVVNFQPPLSLVVFQQRRMSVTSH